MPVSSHIGAGGIFYTCITLRVQVKVFAMFTAVQRITRCLFMAAIGVASLSSAAELDITGAGSSAAQPLYRALSELYVRRGGAALDYKPIGSSGGIKKIKCWRRPKTDPLVGVVPTEN